jgi:class 3 adenylate cyclase
MLALAICPERRMWLDPVAESAAPESGRWPLKGKGAAVELNRVRRESEP